MSILNVSLREQEPECKGSTGNGSIVTGTGSCAQNEIPGNIVLPCLSLLIPAD